MLAAIADEMEVRLAASADKQYGNGSRMADGREAQGQEQGELEEERAEVLLLRGTPTAPGTNVHRADMANGNPNWISGHVNLNPTCTLALGTCKPTRLSQDASKRIACATLFRDGLAYERPLADASR